MTRPPQGRALAIFAVGFLLIDAVLLVWFGLELHRGRLVVGGIVCVVAAVAVVFVWRRYRDVLADLETHRREMKGEVDEIRRLLKEKNLHN